MPLVGFEPTISVSESMPLRLDKRIDSQIQLSEVVLTMYLLLTITKTIISVKLTKIYKSKHSNDIDLSQSDLDLLHH